MPDVGQVQVLKGRQSTLELRTYSPGVLPSGSGDVLQTRQRTVAPFNPNPGCAAPSLISALAEAGSGHDLFRPFGTPFGSAVVLQLRVTEVRR